MTRSALFAGHRVVISDDCVGTAQCVGLAPDVFCLDGDGLATFVSEPNTGSFADVRVAEDLCPMAAISVTPYLVAPT